MLGWGRHFGFGIVEWTILDDCCTLLESEVIEVVCSGGLVIPWKWQSVFYLWLMLNLVVYCYYAKVVLVDGFVIVVASGMC